MRDTKIEACFLSDKRETDEPEEEEEEVVRQRRRRRRKKENSEVKEEEEEAIFVWLGYSRRGRKYTMRVRVNIQKAEEADAEVDR